jgi:hypothetical protein
MSKFFDVPVRRAKMATLVLGAGLNADANSARRHDRLGRLAQPDAGQKADAARLEFKFTGDFTTANGDAALRARCSCSTCSTSSR